MKFENKVIDKVSVESLKEFEGCYIAFGGRGIVDGLVDVCRACCYRLIEVNYRQLVLKGYYQRGLSRLDRIMWDQTCQVVTKKEFMKLQKYG